jgi:hypothetical protein
MANAKSPLPFDPVLVAHSQRAAAAAAASSDDYPPGRKPAAASSGRSALSASGYVPREVVYPAAQHSAHHSGRHNAHRDVRNGAHRGAMNDDYEDEVYRFDQDEDDEVADALGDPSAWISRPPDMQNVLDSIRKVREEVEILSTRGGDTGRHIAKILNQQDQILSAITRLLDQQESMHGRLERMEKSLHPPAQ